MNNKVFDTHFNGSLLLCFTSRYFVLVLGDFVETNNSLDLAGFHNAVKTTGREVWIGERK